MPAKKATPTTDSSAPAAKKAPAKKAAAKKAPAKKAASAKPAASRPDPGATAKPAPAHEDIAKAAYLNYRSRKEKGIPGDSHGDWLDAERKLKGS